MPSSSGKSADRNGDDRELDNNQLGHEDTFAMMEQKRNKEIPDQSADQSADHSNLLVQIGLQLKLISISFDTHH